MKALSIKQPWGWLITQGFKTIENRSWPTRLRGTILIHAGKGVTRADYEEARNLADTLAVKVPEFEALGGVGSLVRPPSPAV